MDRLGPYLLGPNGTPENGIYCGDARELVSVIPDESVGLIACDPPYLKADLPIFSDLACMAQKKLKPGCLLVAYGAGEHLPDHLRRLGEHLQFYWVFVLLHNGGYPRMWHKKLMSGYKPVLVYSNGPSRSMLWMSTVHTDSMDKRFHKWGQGEGFFRKIVECQCPPGSVVFDPFCGGDSAPAACKAVGRRYLAFEIDPEACEIARQRVRDAQPPLFVPEPVQLGLLPRNP